LILTDPISFLKPLHHEKNHYPSTPGGAKIKMEGDILYLTQLVHQIVSQNVSGVTIKTDENATILVKLKKQ
jgi:hypothetical protein